MPDLTSVTKEDLTVRMNIPIADPVQNLSTDNPQTGQVQNDPLSPEMANENINDTNIESINDNSLTKSDNLTSPPQIIRDKLGRIVRPIPQDTNKNGTAGRPCGFCKNKDEVMRIAKEYFDTCRNGKTVKIPFLEELALDLDITEETLTLWAKKKSRIDPNGDSLEHPEFYEIWSKINLLQKLMLSKRILGRFNPQGAISLLKWHHDMIETEKRMLVGDKNSEPLEVRIIEEKQHGE
jgi:hypothetical protein